MQGLLALTPCRDGIVLVEPTDVGQLLSQPRERRLALEIGIDDLGPGLGGEGHDRPVHEPLVDDLEPLLEIGKLVAAGSFRIDAIEDPGGDPRDEDDPGGVHVSELEHPLPVPLGHELERVFRGVLEAGFLDIRVEVGRIDEAGAAFVSALGNRTDDRFHAGLRLDRDDLAGLDVGAEVDGQVCEAFDRGGFHEAGG